MGNTQTNVPFTSIDEVLLVKQIDHVKPNQEFLAFRQRENVCDGKIVRRVRIEMR
jgi:hypothetical protein